MSQNSMSLKAKINNYAKSKNIASQVVLQNYMFERFLQRLSISAYKDKFIIKGGMLIATLVGLDTRATMDLDATLRNLPLTQETMIKTVNDVCCINVADGVIFKFISIKEIRNLDVYGGYCVRVDAIYENITTPLSIDISTADVITPAPIQYEIHGLFDEELCICLWGYNIETILAEKVETILSRGILNTRPRDFYDVYILTKSQSYDKGVFKTALKETAIHRGSYDTIQDVEKIINQLSNNATLRDLWEKYQKTYNYARGVCFEDVIVAVTKVAES